MLAGWVPCLVEEDWVLLHEFVHMKGRESKGWKVMMMIANFLTSLLRA